jgi:hypothetical protein
MKSPSTDLFDLIHALSPAEKKHFHRFAQRHVIGEGNLYLQLFKILSAQRTYDETQARLAIQQDKGRFAVSKKQLYDLILEALPFYHRAKESREQLKRWIQSAHILIDKGLISQAEKLWKKSWAKAQAEQLQPIMPELLLLERILLEKKIGHKKSEQFIASWQQKWQAMLKDMEQMGNAAYHGLLIAREHHQKIRPGQQQATDILTSDTFRQALQSELASVQLDCQRAISTYHFMQGQAQQAYASNATLLSLFDQHPFLSDQYPSRYLMALNNFLIDNFQLQNWQDLEAGLEKLKKLPDTPAFKKLRGIKKKIFEQSTLLEVNMLSVQKAFTRLSSRTTSILESLPKYGGALSYPNHQSLLYILAMGNCFAGQADTALGLVNEMLDKHRKNTLEELHHHARLLQLLIHYELNNLELLPYLIASVRRALPEQTSESTTILLAKLSQLASAANKQEKKNIYQSWAAATQQKELQKREHRFYEYLDMVYWLKLKTGG